MSFGASHSSSSSTPTWASQFTPTLNAVESTTTKAMTDPESGLAAVKANAVGDINKSYESLPDQIQSSLSSRGMGRSGQMTDLTTKAELGRKGALGQFEGSWASMLSNRQMQAASLADQLLAIARGTQSSGTSFGGGVSLTGPLNGGITGMSAGSYRG